MLSPPIATKMKHIQLNMKNIRIISNFFQNRVKSIDISHKQSNQT